jgi:hypothetical protein
VRPIGDVPNNVIESSSRLSSITLSYRFHYRKH